MTYVLTIDHLRSNGFLRQLGQPYEASGFAVEHLREEPPLSQPLAALKFVFQLLRLFHVSVSLSTKISSSREREREMVKHLRTIVCLGAKLHTFYLQIDQPTFTICQDFLPQWFRPQPVVSLRWRRT